MDDKNRAVKCGTNNYNAVDLAKFICAIFVVAIHVTPFGASGGRIVTYMNFGVQNYIARIAVPYFFIASGFFLFKKTSWEDFDIKVSIKYIKRIFRLYVTWTLIYFPFSVHDILKDTKGVLHKVLVYLRNCIFSGSFVQLWYLTALIFAVVVISLLIHKRVKIKYIVAVAAVLYFVGLFAQSWFGLITPLREALPLAWNFLRLAKKVIITTRDGLFEGFLFVSIGMCFAFCNITISKIRAFVGFACSMAALFLEVFILKYYEIARACDMFLFLVPAAFFMFAYTLRLNLADRPIYKTLRHLSSLIFYSHYLFLRLVSKLLKIINEPLSRSCLHFILTLIVTLVFSAAVIKLSDNEKFKRLKILYQ